MDPFFFSSERFQPWSDMSRKLWLSKSGVFSSHPSFIASAFALPYLICAPFPAPLSLLIFHAALALALFLFLFLQRMDHGAMDYGLPPTLGYSCRRCRLNSSREKALELCCQTCFEKKGNYEGTRSEGMGEQYVATLLRCGQCTTRRDSKELHRILERTKKER